MKYAEKILPIACSVIVLITYCLLLPHKHTSNTSGNKKKLPTWLPFHVPYPQFLAKTDGGGHPLSSPSTPCKPHSATEFPPQISCSCKIHYRYEGLLIAFGGHSMMLCIAPLRRPTLLVVVVVVVVVAVDDDNDENDDTGVMLVSLGVPFSLVAK